VPPAAAEGHERPECSFEPEIALTGAHRAQAHHLPVELAALHRQKKWRRAGVAAHHGHVEPEHLLGDQREDEIARGGIIGAQHHPHGGRL